MREDTGEAIENPITHALRTGKPWDWKTIPYSSPRTAARLWSTIAPRPYGMKTDSSPARCSYFETFQNEERSSALRRSTCELEKTAAELRRSNEDLSQFAYIASHDLRSPLKTVADLTQLLARNYGDKLGEGKELLGHVTDATRRMAKLIDDLLIYATATTKGAVAKEPVDANMSARGSNRKPARGDSGVRSRNHA